MIESASSVREALDAGAGHRLVETPVTTLASGQLLMLTAHVLRGARPGPTVGIVSGLHGDEFSTAEVVLSLIDHLPAASLSGALVLLPTANPRSFEAGSCGTPFDMGDLNRVVPGDPNGPTSHRLAHVLGTLLFDVCEAILDLHSRPDSMAIRCCYSPPPDDDHGRRSLALAVASGSSSDAQPRG